MAVHREVIEHLTDDFDGSSAVETIHFALEGKSYVLDLNASNAKEMRQIFKPYIDAARRDSTGRSGRSAGSGRRSSSSVDPKAVRAWAKTAKVKVPSRGRVPSTVVEQYLAAR